MSFGLLRNPDFSYVDDDLLKRAELELRDGTIMMAEDFLTKYPDDAYSMTAGSFDPCTRGHEFMMTEAASAESCINVSERRPMKGLVVRSLTKDISYQLFGVLERAALIRAYGETNPVLDNMPLILGVPNDQNAPANDVLGEIHRRAHRIYKGTRGREDSEHTAGLVKKYAIHRKNAFSEVVSSDDLVEVSSGLVKGLIASGEFDRDELIKLANERVIDTTIRAVENSGNESLAVFKARHEAGSSEKMFH